MTSFRQIFGAALVVLCMTGAALAQEPAAADKQAPAAEASLTPEQEAAMKSLVQGPAEVKLRDVATLAIPKGMMFVPADQAAAFLQSQGNTGTESVMGMVVPKEDEKSVWFVVAEYDDNGFIKDAEADKFNADEILDGMKEGIKERNEEITKLGHPAMEIVGWIQKPTYDKEKRQLVWSIAARDVTAPGAPAADPNENSVNYNTFTLGRAGYISLNLVSAQGKIEQDKHVAAELLAGLKFVQGRRYEDFDPKTDKVPNTA
ncbi:MAG: DUF2167 domain-containing protein [Alphaproteobacteria bacterium]